MLFGPHYKVFVYYLYDEELSEKKAHTGCTSLKITLYLISFINIQSMRVMYRFRRKYQNECFYGKRLMVQKFSLVIHRRKLLIYVNIEIKIYGINCLPVCQ